MTATPKRTTAPSGDTPPNAQDSRDALANISPTSGKNRRTVPNPYATYSDNDLPRRRNSVSRLSEGLEPMHIHDGTREFSNYILLVRLV